MRKLLVCGAVAVAYLGAAGTASAADIYYEGSMKDTVQPAPVPIWSGLYIGGTLGYGAGDTSDDFDIKTEGTGADTALESAENTFLFDFPEGEEGISALEAFLSNDYDMDGAIYGAFLGYNWQNGNAVFGVEGGINGTDFDGHTDCALIADCSRELDYYARVVGRLGYARDNLLFYGFGGVAWGDVSTDVSLFGKSADDSWDVDDDADFSSSFNQSQTHVGWTAGVGLEVAFTERFFAGVEYAHVDLGEESYRALSYADNGDSIHIDNNVDVEFDVIKLRASYKLWSRQREPIESFK